MKNINKTASVIRDAPAELVKAVEGQPTNSDGLWAYASVEITDTAQDVVRIDGINTKAYHDPTTGLHLKILAGHAKSLQDGMPSVIGRVERFAKTNATVDGKPVPALAFYMTWAKDGSGAYTPLAKAYKDLYDGGYMDQFSVGLAVDDYEPLQDGGFDFKATTLVEVSCVSVPANRLASVIRSMGDGVDREALLTEAVGELSNRIEHAEKSASGLAQKLAEITTKYTSTCDAHKEVETRFTAELTKQFDALTERLDLLEAGIVAKSEGTPTPTGDRKSGATATNLNAIKAELERLAKTVGR